MALIRIQIDLWGALRGGTDTQSMALELPAGSTVADLKRHLAQELSRQSGGEARARLVSASAVADDSHLLTETSVLAAGARLAVLPPVSGG